MKIVPYDPMCRDDSIQLKEQWISVMFVIAPEDIRELETVDQYIESGGQICSALD